MQPCEGAVDLLLGDGDHPGEVVGAMDSGLSSPLTVRCLPDVFI